VALNLRQIEVFRAVMVTGSIKGAAQLLFVSQPAVSRLLSHTESRIGFALFERIRGRLHATPEAKRLFNEVEQLFGGIQRVNALARELAEHNEGILHLVASPSIGHLIVPMAMAEFRRNNPQVKQVFHYLAREPLIERLLSRQADLAVTTQPIVHPNLEMEVLGHGRMLCICPPDHPLASHNVLQIEDLQPYPLIGYDRASPFGVMVGELFDKAGISLRTVIEAGSPQNVCALVQAGAGIALVDEFSVKSWETPKFVMRPLANAPLLNATLVRLRTEPLSQIAQEFVTVMRAVMRREGASMDETEIALPIKAKRRN
jgi:DNA-binding transcriptional LysR family regulator